MTLGSLVVFTGMGFNLTPGGAVVKEAAEFAAAKA